MEARKLERSLVGDEPGQDSRELSPAEQLLAKEKINFFEVCLPLATSIACVISMPLYQVPLLALNDIIQTFAGPRSSMESFIKERCFVQSKLRTGILLQRKVIPIPLVQSKLKSLPMAVLIWIYLKMKQGVCCLCCCKRRRGRNHRKKNRRSYGTDTGGGIYTSLRTIFPSSKQAGGGKTHCCKMAKC